MEARTFLLDGIWGRPRRFEGLLQMLRDRGQSAEIFHYDASGITPFEKLAEKLAAEIRTRNDPVNLIGFSMGGLVIRAAHQIDPTLPIQRAAFLNSPHDGSMLAYLCPVGAIAQMRPTDGFIRKLKQMQWNIPTFATWCPCDTAIVPGRSARWEKAEEIVRCAVPMHVWPIYSKSIWRQVVEFLTEN